MKMSGDFLSEFVENTDSDTINALAEGQGNGVDYPESSQVTNDRCGFIV